MTSRINGLNELNLIGHIVSAPKQADQGPSIAFQLRTTERWNTGSHTEYHYCVVFNAKIAEFITQSCPIGTLAHAKGNIRHNSHNGRTDVLVREWRKMA